MFGELGDTKSYLSYRRYKPKGLLVNGVIHNNAASAVPEKNEPLAWIFASLFVLFLFFRFSAPPACEVKCKPKHY